MTFSIVARCAETGMFGVAVTSSSPAVAARCAYARAGVGAAASQNITDPRLGVQALDLLSQGASALEAVKILRRTGSHIEFRQLLAVDAAGATAIHSGANILGRWGQAEAENAACAGNLLASEEVPQAMLEAFTGSSGPLGDRLIGALQAGLAAGGEEGPLHSSGMLMVREVPWPVADLRVDWTEGDPIAELAGAWRIFAPQVDDYVRRALNPEAAPSYGVPGDE